MTSHSTGQSGDGEARHRDPLPVGSAGPAAMVTGIAASANERFDIVDAEENAVPGAAGQPAPERGFAAAGPVFGRRATDDLVADFEGAADAIDFLVQSFDVQGPQARRQAVGRLVTGDPGLVRPVALAPEPPAGNKLCPSRAR